MIVWPHILDWHVQNLPTITGITNVYERPVTAASPGSYITVGFTASGDTQGEWSQSYAQDDYGIVEEGHILCDVVAQSGSTDLKTSRDAAVAIVDAWDTALRQDKSLGGLLSANSTIWLTAIPVTAQNSQGSGTRLIVTVQYRCETWD